MAKLERVRPGDLIRADYVNALISFIEELEGRVATLEGQTTSLLRIDSVEPSGTLQEGMMVTLRGINFSSPATENTITVAGFEVEKSLIKAFGTADKVQFDLPHNPMITAPAGESVPITVRNKQGQSDTVFRTVKNVVQVPVGLGKIEYSQVSLVPGGGGLVTAGGSVFMDFRVIVGASMSGMYTITPESTWPVEIAEQTFTLPGSPGGANQEKIVKVTLKPPAGATTASLTVKGRETTTGSNVVITASPVLTFTVGQPPPPPMNGIAVAVATVFHGALSSAGVTFNKSFSNGNLGLLITAQGSATYTVTFNLAQSSTSWQITSTAGTTFTGGGQAGNPTCALSWPAGTTGKNDLIITLRNTNTNEAYPPYLIPLTIA